METEDIKDLLNQWLRQVNFKSLVHNGMSDKYREYDQYTKILITILGIFTTFDIIFVSYPSNDSSFGILNICGIISTILITILTAFEIHIKYPDSAEHHHILAILYSQIKSEITKFLMKNGNTERDEALYFYEKIQEKLYLIETMEKDCYESIEIKIDNGIKNNNLNIDFNNLLKSKKKIKYTVTELEYLKSLSNEQIINIIESYCLSENIKISRRYQTINDRTRLYNYIIGDLNIPYSFILSHFSQNTVIEIMDIPIILCVDDDPVHNKIIKNSIKDCRVECILDSRIALEAINEKKYNLIIIDYKMPNISGLELTQMIRNSNTYNKNIPIIGMSSYDDEIIKNECLNIGMTEFITKPLIKKKLLKIKQYI